MKRIDDVKDSQFNSPPGLPGHAGHKSLLENKAISAVTQFNGNRIEYKDWWYDFKNVLFDVVRDPAVGFWIAVEEKAIRDPMGIKE